MSTDNAAETPDKYAAFADAGNKALASTGVFTPLPDALKKSVENSKKLIDQADKVAKRGPVYAMVYLSLALIAFSITFAEMHSSDSADFIVGVIIATVLLIVAGILQLVNNVTQARVAAQQVSDLSAANERILKYAIERGAVLTVSPPETPPASPSGPSIPAAEGSTPSITN
jgi:hypothetical protein